MSSFYLPCTKRRSTLSLSQLSSGPSFSAPLKSTESLTKSSSHVLFTVIPASSIYTLSSVEHSVPRMTSVLFSNNYSVQSSLNVTSMPFSSSAGLQSLSRTLVGTTLENSVFSRSSANVSLLSSPPISSSYSSVVFKSVSSLYIKSSSVSIFFKSSSIQVLPKSSCTSCVFTSTTLIPSQLPVSSRASSSINRIYSSPLTSTLPSSTSSYLATPQLKSSRVTLMTQHVGHVSPSTYAPTPTLSGIVSVTLPPFNSTLPPLVIVPSWSEKARMWFLETWNKPVGKTAIALIILFLVVLVVAIVLVRRKKR